MCVCVCVFSQPLYHEQDATQDKVLSGLQLVLNSELSFFEIGCHHKAKEPSLPYYLSIAREKRWIHVLSLSLYISRT